MELYACGFNAHGQLNFSNSSKDSPQDIYLFQKILTGKSIRLLFAGWSTTVVEVDGTLRSNKGVIVLPTGCSSQDISSVFGDHTGVCGALTVAGDLLIYQEGGGGEELALASSTSSSLGNETRRISHLSISGIGKLCISASSSDSTPPANESRNSGSDPPPHPP